jgi:hypothetical protein
MEWVSDIKNYKISFYFLLYYALSFLFVQNFTAQAMTENSIDNNKFEILRSQINLFSSYINLSKTQKNLLSEADSLGLNGEYEIGLIYLEEILEGLNTTKVSGGMENTIILWKQSDQNIDSINDFSMSFITGIDFDKHEFEYGYETSDSTILEELNKPYTGFSFDYMIHNSEDNRLNFYNSLRYDNENLRNNYQINFLHKNLNLKYGGYINNSNTADYSSYWENNFQINFSEKISEKTKLSFRNVYNYKTFEKSDLNYTDYYRNYFETSLEYQYFQYDVFAQYVNEMNEYLGNDNYDYKQHTINMGYRNLGIRSFQHSISIDYQFRNYQLLYGDSTITNSYLHLGCLVDFSFTIYKSWNIHVENYLIKKIYKNQSTFEPNYFWNYFKPGIEVDVFSFLQFGFGYEWEKKSHTFIEEDDLASTEQDYNSNGLFSSLNYFSLEGITFSLSLSYQLRRYPESPTNDLINLYSSRNVLSLIALSNIPLTSNFSLNVLAVYDNDKDVDNDQGNTQSSIFNLELEYKF